MTSAMMCLLNETTIMYCFTRKVRSLASGCWPPLHLLPASDLQAVQHGLMMCLLKTGPQCQVCG